MIVLTLFFISLFFLFYIYGGYYLLLKLISFFSGKVASLYSDKISTEKEPETKYLPVTIYLSAYNEEGVIKKRLHNLIELDYPRELVEILIISDGSTDRTVDEVSEFIQSNPSADIKLFAFEDNQGPARAQNLAAQRARHDILISTGAHTVFSKDLLKEIIKDFRRPEVGVVGGRVEYISKGSPIGSSYRTYRGLERNIRILETALNICVKTDGACTAYRKKIWEHINPYEDVDQVIPLVARKKGYLTVHNDRAVTYDMANLTRKQEIHSRARMTRKALFSICARWHLGDIMKYPLFSFALFSHKVLRFFSPLYILIAIFTGVVVSIRLNFIWEALALSGLFISTLKAVEIMKIPLLKSLWPYLVSFVYANTGFMLGIIQWLSGNREGRFRPTRRY